MELKYFKRLAKKKSQSKRERLRGRIPAVIYKRGSAGEAISVDMSDFRNLIKGLKRGRLATTQITLIPGESIEGESIERRAIIKEIQYHRTTYAMLHLDFQELRDDVHVNVNVPIDCTGMAECVGIKHGGVLRQVLRHIRVRCLPKDIPSFFQLGVTDLDLKGTRRLKDLEIPDSVSPLVNLDRVAVVIAKR